MSLDMSTKTIRTCFGLTTADSQFVRLPPDTLLKLRRLGLTYRQAHVVIDLASRWDSSKDDDVSWSANAAERTGVADTHVCADLRAVCARGLLSVAEPPRPGRATRYHLQPLWDALSDVDTSAAFPRRERKVTAEETSESLPVGDVRREWFDQAFGQWPQPIGNYRVENVIGAHEAFVANMTTAPADWGEFQAALQTRLDRYYQERKPAEEKRKFLGTFRKFCQTWREYREIIAKAARLKSTPRERELGPSYGS